MRRGTKRIASAALAAGALTAAVAFAASGVAAPGDAARRPSTRTRILYQGFDTVRSIHADGSHQTILAHVDLDPSHHIINLRDLAGSRNGKRIVVVTESINSGPGGGLNHRIIRFNGRGKQRKPLFSASFTHGTTSISITADGKQIVFPTTSGLTVASADGSHRHVVLPGVRVKHPAVSSDGKRIVFERNLSGNQDIWALDRTSGSLTRLTSAPGDETWPVFSPLGNVIAYGSDRSGGELRVMSARGTGDHLVTHSHAGEETRPDFSPGGNSLVYVGKAGGRFVLFTIRVDGTHRKAVGEHGAAKGPQWTRLP